MRARYTVYAPPSGVRHIGSALTPPMHGVAKGWMSSGVVHGQPGTQAIPAPAPALPRCNTNLMNVGVHKSSDAPNVWFPRLYYEVGSRQELHSPVSRVSDNQIPVAANSPAGTLIPRRVYAARIGGQRQIAQPQVIQRYPGLRGGYGG